MIFASFRSLLLSAVALGGLLAQTQSPAPPKPADTQQPPATKAPEQPPTPAPAPAPVQAPAPVPVPAPAPEPPGLSSPAEVHNVYLLQMGHGFDQYLATQIVRRGIYRVVTDASKADAILTDRIGRPLESKLDELYPKPQPPEAKPVEEAKQTDDEAAQAEATRRQTEAAMDKARNEWMATRSTYGRGRGTIYMVDRHNRNVLWSAYMPPKNTTPDELDHIAQKIVEDIVKWIKPPK